MENREYLYELDYLKGASILGVVAIHVSGCALVFFPQINFSSIYSILFNQASRFCIPIFLMIAAYIYENYTQPTFIIWSGYFMLGCLIGRYYDAFRLKMQRVKMSYIIFIFIPSAAYMLWDYSLSLNVYETFFNNPAENFFRISVFIYSVAAFLFFFKLALINGNNKLMPFLGRYSFGIYLIHIAFLNPSLNMTKILFSNWIMTTVTFFLSIGFSVMIVFLLRKVSWGWIIVGPLRRPMKRQTGLGFD